MTWTYGSSPDTSTADGRRDAVRLLIGDTDTSDQQIQDEEVSFFLSQASNKVYSAAALAARAVASKYSRLVNTEFDEVSTDYSDLQKHYTTLAYRLEEQANSYEGASLGVKAGGISIAAMDAVEENTDRPEPAFKRNQFRNPPSRYDYYGTEE